MQLQKIQNLIMNRLYDALEKLLGEKVIQRKWEDRERIGFKKN